MILLQDSGRSGKKTWAVDSIIAGIAAGVIISPFDTPYTGRPRQTNASEFADAAREAGGGVFFDPSTHAALLPSSDRFERYDTWPLWGAARGALNTADAIDDHVGRVNALALELGAVPVAPTSVLTSAVGAAADRSLALAQAAIDTNPQFALAIVGTSALWTMGAELDDFIGQIAQLRPRDVFVSVMRDEIALPATPLGAADISGLCRSIHSLSERSNVTVAHGDLAALPAVAVGATGLGTGWDVRQRVLASDAFRTQTMTRRSSYRVTHERLLAVLKRPAAERLRRQNQQLSEQLVPGPLPPNGNALWIHHLEVLSRVVDRLVAEPNRAMRVRILRDLYQQAIRDFESAANALLPRDPAAAQWVFPLAVGLADYTANEGL